eukprot:jgi/Picsp_1/1227/NSC_04708-R1_nadph-cytochrome p450 reductase
MQELTQLFGSAISLIGGIVLAICALAALLLNEVAKLREKKGRNEEETAANGAASGEAAEQDTRAHCTILYGTQTGTAEKFAKTLKSQLESAYGSTTAFHLVDAENYNAEERLAKEKFAIFIVATYGDGEPTDSAVDLHDYLKEQVELEDEGVCLDGMAYAVFGLGNRQYEHFCSMGKKVQKWLLALGALPLMKLGKGDDDDDIDKDFDEWSVNLFQVLAESDVLEAGSTEEVTADLVPAYDIEDVHDGGTENVLVNGSGTNAHSAYLAGVTYVRELHTAESDRSCVHVEVDISGCDATYESGDHIGVYPENDAHVVEQAAKVLGESLDRRFVMRMPEKKNEDLLSPPISGPMTLEFALTQFADLLSSPSKASLKMLSAFASDQGEHEQLVRMSSLGGVDEFDKYIHGPKRSLLEVLAAFPSARPSLGAFFGSICPRLQPRYYSISSSPKMHPSSVHITCAVVKETMPTGRVHNGVASTWLARLTPGQKIPVFLRGSSFKLPENLKSPVIMVGPGTGLAPFRGFIQDRQADASQGKELGPGILYFGCRNRNQDYIYQKELEDASKDGSLTRLDVAFSREGKNKDYVQHHIAKDGADLWQLLSQKDAPGYLYICGDGKYMAKDVNRVLHDIVVEQVGCSGNEAEAIIKEIADQGRYLKDVW